MNMFLFHAGFTSNGEYNSMRSRGYTRPLSVLQIKANVRTKYSRLSKQTMLNMLTPQSKYIYLLKLCLYPINLKMHSCIITYMCNVMYIASTGGLIKAVTENPAVPTSLLIEIHLWKSLGIEWKDIIARLLPRTVPSGYPFHNWITGRYLFF